MRSFLRYTLLALPLLGGVVAEQPSTQTSDASSSSLYANAHEAFQDLLNALPDESLQAALNSLTKFKAGVFESHRRGVEHVHSSSPALATRLIVAAVQDLRKRQQPAASNATVSVLPSSTTQQSLSQALAPDATSTAAQQDTSSAQDAPSTAQDATSATQDATSATQDATSTAQDATSTAQDATSTAQDASSSAGSTAAAPPASTAVASTSTAPRPVAIPVEVTTTNSAGSTVIQTSEVLSKVTASVDVTVTRTTTNSRGSTVAVTTQEVRPAVIHTTTDSRGSSVVVTSAGMLAPTSGEVMTTTDAKGSVFLTTYTPAGGKVSSIELLTTTDAQGQPITRTSIIEVDPTDVAGDGDTAAASATATQTKQPSVQSGSAQRNGAAVAGLAVGAFAMFL